MFSNDSNSRSGSRRLGGPILLEDLWPALRENLREVSMLGEGRATGAEGLEPQAPSPPFSKAA
jgi:hypothetical protein